jgi:hypothetical protein
MSGVDSADNSSGHEISPYFIRIDYAYHVSSAADIRRAKRIEQPACVTLLISIS